MEREKHENDFCAGFLTTGFTKELTLLQVVVADAGVCGVRHPPTRGMLTFSP